MLTAPFLCPASSVCGVGPLGYYTGSLAVTEAGAECLNWAEFPDYVQQYPDHGLGDHNHCRNPDGGTTPWCFYRLASGAIGWANCDCNQGKDCCVSLPAPGVGALSQGAQARNACCADLQAAGATPCERSVVQ